AHWRQVEAFDAGPEQARGLVDRRGRVIYGLRKNGAEFPAAASISKLEVAGKKLFTVVLRDVTEERRAHEELRQSQERFELALEGGDLASWDWNIETGDVVFNRRFAEMRGLRLEDIRPHVDTWIEGLHPDDRPDVWKKLTEHFEGLSSVYESVHRVRSHSGQWLWILDRGKFFARDAAGRPTRMVGTELDITERKRVEDEQRFLAEVGRVLTGTIEVAETLMAIARLAVQQLADCVIVDLLEDDGQLRRELVVHAEPSKVTLCARLKEVPLDPRRPHFASALLETGQPALRSEVEAGYVESVAQNEEHLRALRELDPRSIMTVPLAGRGRVRGALTFVSSAPTRRYGPQDLHLATALAQRAALAFDNASLYEAARRATQMRDDVLGIVAHDLRNPLGTILMQAALLKRRADAPDLASRHAPSLDIIERAATRMTRLIEDLLDVTQMEAGRLSVQRGSIPAERVVADAVESQETLASSVSVDLRLDLARDLPEVWADRDRLLQVFENLIGNAVKFTAAGGRVTVGAAPHEGEVRFWVADTGKGIAPEDVPRVFDRFWQAQHAGRYGAGLGLPVVKGIVEAHGGRVWVESAPGQGSTFFFTIPVAPRPEVPSRASAH
ncbi:MAG TPA: ATP-binding protein, partial [Labilithrix sp.]|nr:ATP-binding protein [Labilithrix sp.]